MQRSLIASVIILSLSACDGNDETVSTPADSDKPVKPVDTDLFEDDKGDDGKGDDGKGDDGKDDGKDDAPVTTESEQISDDAGSATSDGAETEATTETETAVEPTPVVDNTPISDDAASATSDGGEISDDAASATSDGGEISDDAASATSDGGEISDDAASSSSDGGQVIQAPVPTTPAPTEEGPRNTDAGSFTSDNADGSVIRRSTLASSGSQNICTSVASRNDFGDTRIGDFILHNNAWRPWRVFPDYNWEQCVYTNTNGAVAGWNYDWGPGRTGINGNPNASGDFYVRSYPELIYGVKDEFRTSAPKSVTGFPVALGEMPNIRIDYSYDGPQYGDARTVNASNNPRFPNGTTIQGERNVAIESFLYEPDASGQCSEGIVSRSGGSNHVYEVMVWLDAGAERLPAGPSDYVADLNIRGADYKVYTKGSDPRYIAFVAQNPQTTGTIYWNDFTDWARDNAHVVRQRFGARSNSVQIQDRWCVANIIVGTEIFWGAGNIDIYDWTITQSR